MSLLPQPCASCLPDVKAACATGATKKNGCKKHRPLHLISIPFDSVRRIGVSAFYQMPINVQRYAGRAVA